MEQAAILKIRNACYPVKFDSLSFLRDAGSRSHIACAQGQKYILRLTSPVCFDTAQSGVDIQLYLQNQGFPVPSIIPAADGRLYILDFDISCTSFLCIISFFTATGPVKQTVSFL